MTNSVVFKLQDISLEVEGSSQEEILQIAKERLLKHLQSIIDDIPYQIYDTNRLSIQTAYPGMIVENENHEAGIITSVNKKTINVAMENHHLIHSSPQQFKRSQVSFEKVRNRRIEFMMPDWFEGDSGYVLVENEMKPVVIGKHTHKYINVYVVGEKEERYKIHEDEIDNFIKDERDELSKSIE